VQGVDLFTAIQVDMCDLNFAIARKIRQIKEEAFFPTGDKKAAMNREPDFASIAETCPNSFQDWSKNVE
jgi:hypothetical protein